MEPSLLVFLRYPEPGRVKTRLAAAIGDQGACDVYRTCAELTLARIEPLQRNVVLYADRPDAMARITQWLGGRWLVRPQRGATLGERLAAATTEAFDGGADSVVVIGTDSPWLGPSEIETAFTALTAHDVVLGPTEDGGYYLIGLSRPHPELFEGIAWSSSQVFAQTQACAQALGLRVATLPMGYDVDRVEDVARLLADPHLRLTRADALAAIERVIPINCIKQ